MNVNSRQIYNLKYVLFIVAIILLAISLRFYQLGKIPEGFHVDETAFGYNAYSILKTGKDEFGKAYPLTLQSYGDFKGAIYSYLAIPFIHFFGLNEWSVRVPSAIFGVIFIFLTFLITRIISKNTTLAILSMLLATISPVGILLSRVQSDPLVSVVFMYLGVYVLLLWVQKQRNLLLFCFALLMFLSFYTNTITRIFAIPFIILFGVFYWKTISVRARVFYLIMSVVISLLLITLSANLVGVRFNQVSIFHSMTVQLPLEEELREDGVGNQPLLLTRIIHNKPTAYARYLLKNLSDYLSFDFLFLQAKQPLREKISNMGILPLAELPFLLMGIYFVFRKKIRYGIFCIGWLLLVPAVLSVAVEETPNIHRFFLAMLPIHILVSLGIFYWHEHVPKKFRSISVVLIGLVFVCNSIFFLHQLFVHQPIHDSIFRNYHYTQLAKNLKKLYPAYDVIKSPAILEHLLFYWKVDPGEYQKLGSPRDTDQSHFGKIQFTSNECPSYQKTITSQRVLYVDKAECPLDQRDRIIEVIKYRNGLDAYRLVEKL